MKALILSVTAGQGHNMCAKAVEEALQERGVECCVLDTLKYINKPTGEIVDKGYLAMGKTMPKVWGAVYNSAVKLSEKKKGPSIELTALRAAAGRLSDFLDEFKPDMIICTHVFASQIITALRQKKTIDVPLYGINTDFTLHPFFEEVDLDYLVVACDKMYYSVIERGMLPEKLLPFGIPVRQKFNRRITPQQGREEIGFEEKTTLCIMGGSMGFGHLYNDVLALDQLPSDFQMVVICGNNHQLYDQLIKEQKNGKFNKKIHIYSFTDQVDTIMRASDAICTKPGGLSTSETLACGRPLILLEPIPGLEEYNAWFLVNNGVAVHTGKCYELPEAVYNLFCDPRRMQDILSAQECFFPKDSANHLADFIMDNQKNINIIHNL